MFIADLHSVTQIKDGKTLRENTYSVAATWLACGLDISKVVFYRQSDVPQTAELAWYLNCFFPFQRLTLAHSFKDKADRLDDVNAGLLVIQCSWRLIFYFMTLPLCLLAKINCNTSKLHVMLLLNLIIKWEKTFVLPEAKVEKKTA